MLRYLLNSIAITILDATIVWILQQKLGLPLILANSIGVIAGTIVGYFLTSRYVFVKAKGKKGFCIYMGTFLLGLIVADFLIHIGNEVIFQTYSANRRFFYSKAFSIVTPFYGLYELRRRLYERFS